MSVIPLFGPNDWCLFFLGCLCALVTGLAPLTFSFLFGVLLDVLGPGTIDRVALGRVQDLCLLLGALFLVNMGAGTGQGMLMANCSEKWGNTVRMHLVSTILSQSMEWIEAHAPTDLNGRISNDVQAMQEAVVKFGALVEYFTCFFGAICFCFVYSPKLAAVLCCFIPLMITVVWILSNKLQLVSVLEREQDDAVTEHFFEVLMCFKSVIAFGGKTQEFRRLQSLLEKWKISAISCGFFSALSMSSVDAIIYFAYALGLWYGAVEVQKDHISGGQVITIFNAMVWASFALGQAANCMSVLLLGICMMFYFFITNSAGWLRINELLTLENDLFHLLGGTLDNTLLEKIVACENVLRSSKKASLLGGIEFQEVYFAYPSRPQILVLCNVSFFIPPHSYVAFVGSTGCGKSTIFQLLEGFYGLESGKILFDGKDQTSFENFELRNQIAYVGQESCLFSGTIFQNISSFSSRVTMEQVIAAAKVFFCKI